MKSDILLTLIKEVVKSEVKQQVKEEITRLIKSGKISLNKGDTHNSSPLTEGRVKTNMKGSTKLMETFAAPPAPKPKQPVREITKNPILNEILNQTEPFTAAHRVEGAPALGATGGSILDSLQPSVSMEGDWETMDYRGMEMPQQPMPVAQSDNPAVDALTKALTRDYRELVKRFK